MVISDALATTLRKWMRTATLDFPSSNTCIFGLCFYVHKYGGLPLLDELNGHFEREFGIANSETPFDNDCEAYRRDKQKHKNPKRLAWVRKKLAEYDEAVTDMGDSDA